MKLTVQQALVVWLATFTLAAGITSRLLPRPLVRDGLVLCVEDDDQIWCAAVPADDARELASAPAMAD